MVNEIMARFDGEPSLMRENQSMWFQAACQAVVAFSPKLGEIEAADSFWFEAGDWRSAFRPYIVRDGIQTIPVKGLLLNNFSIIYGDYATGYDYIWQAVKRGMADPEVKGIVFEIDSGGGAVNGNFDLVDRIYSLRGQKPMRAFTNEGAYSGAYSIASVTDKIVVGRTAGVGSIGVVTVHGEYSKALEAQGVTVNIIRSKPRKMEGNAYEPLSDVAREGIQARIDALHKQFVAIVARNRDMDEAAVDGTDALCFMPEDAIAVGLADEVGNADDAFTAFAAFINSEQEKDIMAVENQAAIEEAHAAALATAAATALTEGAQAERARISAILDSPEAQARPAAARMLAFDTDKGADAVVAMLGKLPAEVAATAAPKAEAAAGAPKSMFTAAMDNTPNPNLSAGDEQGGLPSRVERALALTKGVKA